MIWPWFFLAGIFWIVIFMYIRGTEYGEGRSFCLFWVATFGGLILVLTGFILQMKWVMGKGKDPSPFLYLLAAFVLYGFYLEWKKL
jgi:hypothetical protein